MCDIPIIFFGTDTMNGNTWDFRSYSNYHHRRERMTKKEMEKKMTTQQQKKKTVSNRSHNKTFFNPG